MAGGNDINKINFIKNKKRLNLDKYYYSLAKKYNIPILGICHGAQVIAKLEGCKLKLKKQYSKKHKVFFNDTNKSVVKVNSYHDLIIVKPSKKIEVIATAPDNSIECFRIKNKKVLGIVWHPERYNKFKKIDFRLVKKIL